MLVEYEAVVIAGTILDLFVVGINILTYSLLGAEIEWSSGHLQNLTSRNGCLVNGKIEIGIDFKQLVVDGWSRICNTLNGAPRLSFLP